MLDEIDERFIHGHGRRLDANSVVTRVLYDEGVDWQRVNFLCMKTIARTLTHVRVEGTGSRS